MDKNRLATTKVMQSDVILFDKMCIRDRNWVFSTENKELIRVDSTAIVRHTKIKATANPFLDEAYFQKRKFDKGCLLYTSRCV